MEKNTFTITCDNCGVSKKFEDKFRSYETDKNTININSFQYATIQCDNCQNRIDED